MNTQASVLPARHILVVDDDSQLREQVVGYLAEHGYLLHAASDAASMEAALAAAPIDLIVLDVMLPGEGGLSICRRMAETGGPAIVMVSACAMVRRALSGSLAKSGYSGNCASKDWSGAGTRLLPSAMP